MLTCWHRPAVILMDINLPGINGIEVLKLLRQDPLTVNIPVIGRDVEQA